MLVYIFKELSGFTRSYCPCQVGRMSILVYVFFICLNILNSKNEIQRKCKSKITQQCRTFKNVFCLGPAESSARSGPWPSSLGHCRPSSLWSVGKPPAPGQSWCALQRARRGRRSRGPGPEAASNLSMPEPAPPRLNGGGPSEPGSCRPLGLFILRGRAWAQAKPPPGL